MSLLSRTSGSKVGGAGSKVLSEDQNGRRKFKFQTNKSRAAKINLRTGRDIFSEPLVSVSSILEQPKTLLDNVLAANLNKEEDRQDKAYLEDALIQARAMDLTSYFTAFREDLVPYVTSLPILLLNIEQVVAVFTKHLSNAIENNKEIGQRECSLTILSLISTLVKDAGSTLTPYVPNLIEAILKYNIDSEDAVFTARAFHSIGVILSELSKYLITQDSKLMFLLPFCGCASNDKSENKQYEQNMLGHRKDYVRRFAAETFSFVIRKLGDKSLKVFLLRLIKRNAQSSQVKNLSQQMQDNLCDGISHLLFNLTKGIKRSFHSKASVVINILIQDVLQGVMLDNENKDRLDETIILSSLQKFFDLTAEQADSDSAEIVWSAIHEAIDTIEKDAKDSEEKKEFNLDLAIRLLNLLQSWITYRHGSRINENEVKRLMALMNKIFIEKESIYYIGSGEKENVYYEISCGIYWSMWCLSSSGDDRTILSMIEGIQKKIESVLTNFLRNSSALNDANAHQNLLQHLMHVWSSIWFIEPREGESIAWKVAASTNSFLPAVLRLVESCLKHYQKLSMETKDYILNLMIVLGPNLKYLDQESIRRLSSEYQSLFMVSDESLVLFTMTSKQHSLFESIMQSDGETESVDMRLLRMKCLKSLQYFAPISDEKTGILLSESKLLDILSKKCTIAFMDSERKAQDQDEDFLQDLEEGSLCAETLCSWLISTPASQITNKKSSRLRDATKKVFDAIYSAFNFEQDKSKISKMTVLVRSNSESINCLRVAFEAMNRHNLSIPNKLNRETIIDSIGENLSSRYHVLRLATLKLMKMLSCEKSNETNAKEVEEMSDKLLHNLLGIEQLEISHEKERERNIYIQDMVALLQSKKHAKPHIILTVHGILGLFHIKYKPVWQTTANALASVSTIYFDVMWPVVLKFFVKIIVLGDSYSDDNDDGDELETNASSNDNELDNQQKLKFGFVSPSILVESFFKALNLMAVKLEGRSKTVLCIFFKFLYTSYFANNEFDLDDDDILGLEFYPSIDLLRKDKKFTSSDAWKQEFANLVQDKEMPNDIKGTGVDLVFETKISNKSLHGRLDMWIELMGCFKKPQKFWGSEYLFQIIFYFITKLKGKAAHTGFKVMTSYKFDYLIPYDEMLIPLSNDDEIRQGLLDFNASIILPEHKERVIKIVTRLLFGKILSHQASSKTSKSRHHTQNRQGSILSLFSSFNSDDLLYLFSLVFRPIGMHKHIKDNKNTGWSAASMKIIKEQMQLARAKGNHLTIFISLLDDVIKQLGMLIIRILPMVLNIICTLFNPSNNLNNIDIDEDIEKSEKGSESKKKSRGDAGSGMQQLLWKQIDKIFHQFPDFDFMPWIPTLSEMIDNSMKNFSKTIVSQESPTPMLQLLHVISSSRTLYSMFKSSRYALPELIESIAPQGNKNQMVSPLVFASILSIIENLFGVISRDKNLNASTELLSQEEMQLRNEILLPHLPSLLKNLNRRFKSNAEGGISRKISKRTGKKGQNTTRNNVVISLRELEVVRHCSKLFMQDLSKKKKDGSDYQHSDVASQIVSLLIPYLNKRMDKSENDELRGNLIDTISSLIPLVKEPISVLESMIKLYGPMKNAPSSKFSARSSRKKLVDLLSMVASHPAATSLKYVADVINNLNSWSATVVEEFDYPTRLSAYDELSNNPVKRDQLLASKNHGRIGLLLLIEQFLFDMYIGDFSIRASALHALSSLLWLSSSENALIKCNIPENNKSLKEKISNMTPSHEDPSNTQKKRDRDDENEEETLENKIHISKWKPGKEYPDIHVFIDIILSEIQNSIQNLSDKDFRNGFLKLLSDIVDISETINKFSERIKAAATESDNEEKCKDFLDKVEAIRLMLYPDLLVLKSRDNKDKDFFLNLVHMQVHRRARALATIRNYIELSKKSDQNADGDDDINEVESPIFIPHTIETVVIPLGIFGLLASTSAEASIQSESKQLLGTVASILPWNKYYALLKSLIKKISKYPKMENIILSTICDILDSYHFSNFDSLSTNQHENANNSSMEIDTSEKETEEEFNSMQKSLKDNILPLLMQYFKVAPPKVISDINDNEKYRKKKGSRDVKDKATFKLHASAAIAIVKLYKLLPAGQLESHLPSILLTIARELLSKDDNTRENMRKLLIRITITIGSSYLHYIVDALVSVLREGYQLHVLCYTVAALLDAIEPMCIEEIKQERKAVNSELKNDADDMMLNNANYQPCGIDHALPGILKVLYLELFGEAAEQKDENSGYKSHMKEVKSSRAFDVCETLGRIISFLPVNSLHVLLRPFIDIVLGTDDVKHLNVVEEVFLRIGTGLSNNPDVRIPHMLVYIHFLITEFAFSGSENDLINNTSSNNETTMWFLQSSKKQIEMSKAPKESKPPVRGRAYEGIGHIEPEIRLTGVSRFSDAGSTLPKKDPKTGEIILVKNPHTHILVEHALWLLLASIQNTKMMKKNSNNIAMLNPMTSILATLVGKSESIRVKVLSLKCLSHLCSWKLPSLHSIMPRICKTALNILQKASPISHSSGSKKPGFKSTTMEGLTGSAATDLVLSSYQMITAMIGPNATEKLILTENQTRALVLFIENDIEVFERQKAALEVLKYIVNRRFQCEEIYRIVGHMTEDLYQAKRNVIRELCTKIIIEFLMNYPLNMTRLQKQLDSIVRNLDFDTEDGRKAGLEMIEVIVMKFPEQAVNQFAVYLFLPVASRLVNEIQSTQCRELAGNILKILFNRIGIDIFNQIIGLAMRWFPFVQIDSESEFNVKRYSLGEITSASYKESVPVMRLGCQVIGLACESAPDKIVRGKHSSKVSLIQDAVLENEMIWLENTHIKSSDDNDAEIDFRWELSYHCLISLEKMLLFVSTQDNSSMGQDNSSQTPKKKKGNKNQSELSTRDMISKMIWGNEQVKIYAKTNGEALSIDPVAFRKTILLLMEHPHSWVRLASTRLITHYLEFIDTSKVEEIFSSYPTIGDSEKSVLFQMLSSIIKQLKSNTLDEKLVDQSVKCFNWLVPVIESKPELFTESGVEDEVDDGSNIQRNFPLNWFLKNLISISSFQGMSEDTLIQTKCLSILKILGLVATQFSLELTDTYLAYIMDPIRKVIYIKEEEQANDTVDNIYGYDQNAGKKQKVVQNVSSALQTIKQFANELYQMLEDKFGAPRLMEEISKMVIEKDLSNTDSASSKKRSIKRDIQELNQMKKPKHRR